LEEETKDELQTVSSRLEKEAHLVNMDKLKVKDLAVRWIDDRWVRERSSYHLFLEQLERNRKKSIEKEIKKDAKQSTAGVSENTSSISTQEARQESHQKTQKKIDNNKIVNNKKVTNEHKRKRSQNEPQGFSQKGTPAALNNRKPSSPHTEKKKKEVKEKRKEEKKQKTD
jgi:hypothetical protein